MAQKYLVALDRARLRIYRFSQQPGQFTPSIQPVDALDFPSASADAKREKDRAGRFATFPGSYSDLSTDGAPLSDDEGEDQQIVDQIVRRISGFLEKNPDSTWTLASGSAFRDEVIEALPDPFRRRLDRVISKDLLNLPPVELREHFVAR